MPIQQTQQTNNPRHVGGPPGSWRRISICLDDFGHHSGVNQAALALARAGRVQALSAMVGAPAWSAGAQALRAGGAGEAEVGLHLDLTEHPVHLIGTPDQLMKLAGQITTIARTIKSKEFSS